MSFPLGSIERQFPKVFLCVLYQLWFQPNFSRMFVLHTAPEDKDSVFLQSEGWPGLHTVHYKILGFVYQGGGGVLSGSTDSLCAHNLPWLLFITPMGLVARQVNTGGENRKEGEPK